MSTGGKINSAESILTAESLLNNGEYRVDPTTGIASIVGGDALRNRRRMVADAAEQRLNPDTYEGYGASTATEADRYRQAYAEDLARQLADRETQLGVVQQIGQTPSVVALQAQQGRAALARALASQAGSTPGGYSPAAARAALLARGQGEAQIAAQSAIGQAEEQRQALAAQLAGYSDIRGADLNTAAATREASMMANKSIAQEAALQAAADQARAQQIGLADERETELFARYMKALGLQYGQDTGPGVGEKIGGAIGTGAGIVLPILGSIWGPAGSAAGGAAAAGIGAGAKAIGAYADNNEDSGYSDERSKTAVSHGDRAVDELLDHLEPYSYRYRNPEMPGAAHGDQHGVMAQDLERSQIGRTLVHSGSDGYRRVDYSPRTLGPVVLAGMARLNARLRDLEA